MAFLAWRAGPWRFVAGLLRLAPATAAYLFDRDRGRLKAAAVREFLRGSIRQDLQGEAEAFALERARSLLRPDAVAAWREWRERGARLVIVTASPEEVVRPFAELLEADDLIGTRLAYDAAGRVSGGFDGENCRGPEKVRRLEALLGPSPRLAAAYGDTGGDREMLAIAEVKGFQVFTGRPG